MDLTEVLEATQEATLVAVHIEVLVVAALEVLVRQQEAQAVGLLDLLVRLHLAEVAAEITKSKKFKIKLLL